MDKYIDRDSLTIVMDYVRDMEDFDNHKKKYINVLFDICCIDCEYLPALFKCDYCNEIKYSDISLASDSLCFGGENYRYPFFCENNECVEEAIDDINNS